MHIEIPARGRKWITGALVATDRAGAAVTRNTSAAIPARDILSGAPLGPALTSWYARRERPRPIRYIAVSSEPMPTGWTHWQGAVYRTTRRDVSADADVAQIVVTADSYRHLLDVANDVHRAAYAKYPGVGKAARAQRDQAVRERMLERADIEPAIAKSYLDGILPHNFLALVAPAKFDADTASKAAGLALTSAELAASIRRDDIGRWVVETGVGGMLVEHGACDSQAEAIAVATAIRDAAWIAAVRAIRDARGGSLAWGTPVVMPYPVQVYE